MPIRSNVVVPVIVLVASLFAVARDEALAQGPPIHTDTPVMLGLAGRGVRSFGKVVRRGKLFEDGDAIDNPDGRKVTIVQFPVVVPYNLFSERSASSRLSRASTRARPKSGRRAPASQTYVCSASIFSISVTVSTRRCAWPRRRESSFRAAARAAHLLSDVARPTTLLPL